MCRLPGVPGLEIGKQKRRLYRRESVVWIGGNMPLYGPALYSLKKHLGITKRSRFDWLFEWPITRIIRTIFKKEGVKNA